jgi:hypothetical protein
MVQILLMAETEQIIRGGGGVTSHCIVQGMMDLLMNRKKCKKKCRSSFEQIIFAFQFSRKVESRNLFSNKKLHL